MSHRLSFTLVVALGLVGTSFGRALAEAPRHVVQYTAYQQTAGPDQPVEYVVQLHLNAVEVRGNHVGWEVDELRIVRRMAPLETYTAWSEPLPFLDTPDGLWWVEHADVHQPQDGEFTRLPHIEGRASAFIDGPSLDYELQGVVYDDDSRSAAFAGAGLIAAFMLNHDGSSESEPADPEEPADGVLPEDAS